ncbi:MAG: aminoacyl-tRNA hydrolase [Candidatus Kapabacteria bacterium]|nr:aminoacyl-tRNA hydrolase [Candidatus Kapabacteria bacterium]
MTIDWIIAGLGNPGLKYEDTRHNIGFMVCDRLCKTNKVEFTQGKGEWLQAIVKIRGKSVLVMKPITYMNNSGSAIAKAMGQYAVLADRVMIIVDEFNFPVGKVHLKSGGSDGGHNGTASVIQHLKTGAFWRLRCGIAKNFGMGELVDYVLKPFTDEEHEARDAMIERGAQAIELVMHAGTSRAASSINADRPLFAEKQQQQKVLS